ncbi:fimbrial protein [Phocaeicola coprocola]|uniref:fimbrial protein n=1 Tax=Phocaeicola coprocola TaxID=310298 RepID=UPI004029340C
MRKMKLIYVWLLGLVAILTACADEEIVKTYNIKEGVPVTVNLKFNVAASAVESRSAQDATVEQTVQRLFVIAFKRNGEISGKTYLQSVNTTGSGTVTLDMYSGTGQQIFAVANPNSGVGTLSYEQLEAVTNLDDFKALSSQLRTGNELSVERMAFLMCGQLEDIAVDTDGNLVGAASNTINLERVDARITFNVKADGSVKGYTNMTFTPKYYQVENIPQGTYLVPRENEDYAETMTTGYASMQAAGKEYYFDEAKRENDDRPYFEFYLLENRRQPAKRITSQEKKASYSEVQNLYALREKRARTENTVDGAKPGQVYVPGDFIFAPADATYVTIRGTLSFQHGTDFYHADVTYTVHLGSTGSDPDDETLVNNYDVCRNTHYTYNVTITGVESMRVEVVSDKEERPGVEGDVIKAGGEVVDLDSHYGRAKFSLTRGDIQAGLSWAISTPFQRGLKVFDRSNYTVNGEEKGTVVSDVASLSPDQVENLKTGLSLNDYRWVQFAINQECVLKKTGEPVPPSAFAKYPGYAAYSSKDLSDKAPAFGGEGYHYSGSETTPIYSKDVVLYDVNQLLNHLFIEANKSEEQGCDLFLKDGEVSYDDDAEVTITAFIDEYVYKYNPTEVYYEIPTALDKGDPDLTLWKDFVNAENRMLHICVKGAQYSPDGNTSWAESVITFSQRPIYTFYDPDSDVSTAWGTEFKNESEDAEDDTDKNLPATSKALNGIDWNKNNNTFNDGRKNTLEVLGQLTKLKWTDVLYLNDGDYGRLKDDYKCVWFACLGRNRDLDGDNIVDQDEIRWYLASVDQLTDIFIAEAAVPNAKLYSQNATSESVPKEHVISSTYHTGSAPWIIWAEEGASRGVYGDSGDTPSTPHTYRCLRNLGLSLNAKDSDLDDYVISKDENGDILTKDRVVNVGYGTVTYTERFIDLSRLEPNTLRAALTGGLLPQNKERDDNDRPYRKFAVLVSAEGSRGNGSYTNVSGLYPQGTGSYISWNSLYNNEVIGNPCPDGYRAPNLRELMLMYTTYPDLFEDDFGGTYSFYLSKTGFSFDGWAGYTDGRPGFAYVYESNAKYGNLKLLNSGEANQTDVKVRCVRDVIGE